MVDYRYVSEEFHGEREPGDKVLDVHWLRLVGEREWLAITRDRLILAREAERRELIESRARVVILRPGDSLWGEMLTFVLERMDWLQRIYREVPPPFACIVQIAEPIENARFADLST